MELLSFKKKSFKAESLLKNIWNMFWKWENIKVLVMIRMTLKESRCLGSFWLSACALASFKFLIHDISPDNQITFSLNVL